VKKFHIEKPWQGVSESFLNKGNTPYSNSVLSVVSLLGVVLIARPTAIFGSASHSVISDSETGSQLATTASPVEKGTQAQRLIAVG
jgi:hypothetical protein